MIFQLSMYKSKLCDLIKFFFIELNQPKRKIDKNDDDAHYTITIKYTISTTKMWNSTFFWSIYIFSIELLCTNIALITYTNDNASTYM